MWVVLSVLVGLFLITAFSGGLALCLRLLAPNMTKRARILTAGGLAGFLPMSIAFGGFFSQAAEMLDDGGSDFALALMSLIVTQIVLWAVFALPAAWWVTEKLDREDSPPMLETDEDTLAIEG